MRLRYLDDDEVPTLEQALLAHMNGDELRRLVALTGEKAANRKGDMAAVVLRHLKGEERLRAAWESLDELQRAAVAEVVHSPSALFPAGRFRAKYGQDPDWGSARKYGYGREPSRLCFFFYKGLIPADLKQRLLQFVPPPAEAAVSLLDQVPEAYGRPFRRWNEKKRIAEEGTEPIPITVHETERAAQRELLSVLRLVDAGKVSVSSTTRRPSASTVAAIGEVLDGGDYYPHVPPKNEWFDENAGPIRAFAWPLLLQAGGLAQLAGSRLQLTKKGRKALSDPPAATLRLLWEGWQRTTLFDELSRIDCVKGQTGRGKRGLTSPSSRREAVGSSLAGCPAGKWIATGELIRFMHATDDFVPVARDYRGFYLVDPQYGSLGYEGYSRYLDERYVCALLLEYTATLGMIDVALVPPTGARLDFRKMWGADELSYLSRYDGLICFRITPLGAYCLGVESGYRPAPVEVKPVLRVLPNLEIAATGADLEYVDRLALDGFATRVSESVWRLESGKLLASIEEGRSLREICDFLAARGGAAIPETVARFFAEMEARSKMLRDRGLARLIECVDSSVAAMIANDRRTRKHCLLTGERHLVVPASSENAFRRALREAGYLVAAAGARQAKNSSGDAPAEADDPAAGE